MKAIFSASIFILLWGCKKEEIIQNPPAVLTKESTNVLLVAPYSTATLNGEVQDEGYTAVTDRGFVYSLTNPLPSVSDTKISAGYGKGIYNVKLDNLELNKKYYYRAFATNSKATSYGSVFSFTTADYSIATVITKSATLLNNTVARLDGEVTNLGGGNINEYGFVASLKPGPTISNSTKLIWLKDRAGIFSGPIASFRYDVPLAASTKYYIRAYAINQKGESYGNELILTTGNKIAEPVKTIVSSVTGRIWMDRNLGASQAATSKSDVLAIGDLYQWGRQSDGHQIRVSEVSNILANTTSPNNGLFIWTGDPKTAWDWIVSPNDNLWQGVNGINNVCPTGFRLPTASEVIAEKLETNNSLLLPSFGGIRVGSGTGTEIYPSGIYPPNTTELFYWTSSVDLTIHQAYTYTASGGGKSLSVKSYGLAVRCIKN